MLRVVQQDSAAAAKSYYKGTKSGYYTEGGTGTGVWGGAGAALLGLSGEVEWREFERLCENKHPQTGERLTPRSRSNRRVGYDASFHAVKSLSLLAEWTLDPDLFEVFQNAIFDTMTDVEKEARARVRRGGVEDESRVTGNLVFASFLHRTTRPLADGEPDPHLHLHVFVFNATFDHEEDGGRWKALDFSVAKKMARYFEACFHSRLTWALRERGYPLERNRKGWEVRGIPEALRKKFSRRTTEIEELAAKLKVRSPEEKAKLGALTRNSKKAARAKEPEDLRTAWAGRMTAEEREQLSRVQRDRKPLADKGFSKELTTRAVERSAEHHFERSSTVPKLWLLETALRWGLGWVLPRTATLEVERRIGEKSLLVAGDRVTSPRVLEEELRLVELGKAGRGALLPIVRGEVGEKSSPVISLLSEEQLRAIHGLLASRDRISLLIGRAGTGKTTLLKGLKDRLDAAGCSLLTCAPTAQASRGVLRDEGFEGAETVAKLLEDTRLQSALGKKSVLLVDEAGMLPVRAAIRLIELAERTGARLLLCGDPSQHGSVERGDVFQVLQTEAGLLPATVKEIRRQRGDYKRAVELLAEGDTERGIGILDDLGWVTEELDAEERLRELARTYAEDVERGKSVLVVSPTHAEGEAATVAIREELRERGRLRDERTLPALRALNLTAAEKRNPESLAPGDVLVTRGGTRTVVGELPHTTHGKKTWEAYRAETLAVAVGDVVKVTRNGKSTEC